MLDRIQNINQGSAYNGGKQQGRSSDFAKYFAKPNLGHSVGKDSINLSPAALYLAELNWQLHNIEYQTTGRILIDFFILNIEVITFFDSSIFYSQPAQNFSLIKSNAFGAKRSSTELEFQYKKEEVRLNSEIGTKDIDAIREVFSRVEQSKFKAEEKPDEFKLNHLIYDIEYELSGEFKHLLNQLYNFLQKTNNLNLKESYAFEKNDSKIILLENIKQTYG